MFRSRRSLINNAAKRAGLFGTIVVACLMPSCASPTQTIAGATGRSGLSCVAEAHCLAIVQLRSDRVALLSYNQDRQSVISSARTGASTVQPAVVPSLSCFSASMCLGAYGGITVAKIGRGVTWDVNADSVPISGVSCGSPSTCEGVDIGGRAASFRDGKWSKWYPVTSGRDLQAVSCWSSDACVAVGGGGMAFRHSGANWTSDGFVDPAGADTRIGDTLTGVSCVDGSFCMAVDQMGRYVVLQSGVWSIPKSVHGLMGVRPGASSRALMENLWLSVSCDGRITCHVAVADISRGSSPEKSNVLAFQSGEWKSDQVVDGGRPIWSISCWKSNCLAGDGSGKIVSVGG